MQYPEFPIASFLSLPLVLLPLPCYIRSRSISIISLAAWLAVMSIIRGVDTLAWAGNVDIKLQVWCDITTKINLGFTVAVPLSSLCLMQRLESIASTRRNTAKSNDRKRQIIEAIVCFGIPMIFMALSYIVQGHRFDIAEDFGCIPAVYFSVAAMFILWIPPLVFSMASFVFSGLTLRHFLRHRISFSTHLRNSQSNINTSHYFRLMVLAITDMCWTTGVNAYILWYNITGGFRPWISWENVHSNFSRIGLFPTILVPQVAINQMFAQFWITPISCVLFFLLLGLGREALADYRAACQWIWHVIFRRPIAKGSTSAPILTSYRPNVRKQDERSSATSSVIDIRPAESAPIPLSTISSDMPTTPSIASRSNSIASNPFHFDRILAGGNKAGASVEDTRSSIALSGEMSSSLASSHSPDTSRIVESQTGPLYQSKGNIYYANYAQPDVPEDISPSSSPSSRGTWYSLHSHDTQTQKNESSGRNVNNNATDDYVVISKTLSIDFVPRVL